MRVLVLYLIGVSWKCRQCADLKYRSQHVAKIPRLLAKARRLRDRLGAGSEIFQDFPPRPLGMHKSSYIESIQEIFKLEYSILQLRRREIEQIMTDCRGCRWGSKQSLDDHWTNISELIYTEGKDE